ncbi:MAG: hypothetical protein E7467_08885 [Ruminococcaceae bacterium]|nr:hypothetical protein [Oscillospiraceae bacterium]
MKKVRISRPVNSRGGQSVEKLDFRQTDRVQKGGKTSKPSASAYDGTVELGLRCKSKCLAQQAFEVLFLLYRRYVRNLLFEYRSPTAKNLHFDDWRLF